MFNTLMSSKKILRLSAEYDLNMDANPKRYPDVEPFDSDCTTTEEFIEKNEPYNDRSICFVRQNGFYNLHDGMQIAANEYDANTPYVSSEMSEETPEESFSQ